VKSNSKEDVSDRYAGLGSGEYGHRVRRISGESRDGPLKIGICYECVTGRDSGYIDEGRFAAGAKDADSQWRYHSRAALASAIACLWSATLSAGRLSAKDYPARFGPGDCLRFA